MRTFLAVLIALSVTACAGHSLPGQPDALQAGASGSTPGLTQDTTKKPGAAAVPCGGPVVSLSAQCWTWLNGNPQLQNAPAGDLFFTFPGAHDSIDYLTTSVTHALSNSISMTVQTDTLSGSPVYNYQFPGDGNTCVGHATARLFLQEEHDNMSGNGKFEFYRWWSVDPAAYELDQNSQMTLSVPLTPDKWSSVFGRRGDSTSAATAGFQGALANVAKVGMTFGGGCFFGHGVNVLNGTARFTMAAFSAS